MSAPRTEQARPTGSNVRTLPARSRRRPALAAGSLALVALCVAVFTTLYLHAGRQVEVIALSGPVAQGATIDASDLTAVRVSLSPGIDPVPVASASEVVGKRAAVALVPGTLLTPADLTVSSGVPSGDALVGVDLRNGLMPAEGLVPGDTVDVVLTAPPGSPDSDTAAVTVPAHGRTSATAPAAVSFGIGSVLATDAVVEDVSVPSDGSSPGEVVVSLVLPVDIAPVVANASAAGQAALVRVTPGSGRR